MKSTALIGLGALTAFTSCDRQPESKQAEKPNVMIIFCDDLGYGDLGCFGATDIATPNIDRMAEQGIKLSAFYSASSICSPSRAGLLTGRMPQRMGVHGVFFPESYTGLPLDEITLADMLHEKGYVNGHIGKWHLGHMEKYLPTRRGFDYYFGIPYSNDMESVVYTRNNDVVEFHVDQSYTTKTYTHEALKFLEENHDRPFFLYLAHSMPHVPIYASEQFLGTSERGLYGDVIQEIDWSTGKILNKLEELGELENTLVIFSSDNGPWLVMEDHGGSAGPLREGKQYTFEGGMRVPTLAIWPAKIPAGIEYPDMALMVDWVPTIAAIVGYELPGDRPYDGVDIQPVLYGEGKREDTGWLYFDNQKLEAYREGDWKIKLAYEGFEGARWKKAVPPHPDLLINLKEDPGETHNLIEEYPEKFRDMKAKMDSARAAMGTLPEALVIKTNADHSHYEYLLQKNKDPDYYKREWD